MATPIHDDITTYQDYLERVIGYQLTHPSFSLGEILYAHLKTMKPQLLDEIELTEYDPFNKHDKQLVSCLKYIKSSWYD